MNDFDHLLKVVTSEARKAGVPVSAQIDPHIVINTRAKKRLGQCRKEKNGFVIELSARLLDAPEKSCRQTIAHELIHTCPGCMNHGDRFRKYAYIMNTCWGYDISRTADPGKLGIKSAEEQNRQAKYVIVCQSCGARVYRMKKTAVTEHPERYRCRCGGRLSIVSSE